jgi:hypothetical protein
MTPDYRKPAPNMAFQPPGGRPSASGRRRGPVIGFFGLVTLYRQLS